MLLLIDRDARVLFLNRANPPFTVEQVVGTIGFDYLSEDQRAGLSAALIRVFEQGETVEFEPFIPATGHWHHCRITPLRENGEIRLATISITDITQRRAQGYSPSHVVQNNPELKRAIETLESGLFTPDNLADSTTVVDRLMSDGEHFLVLADFDSYAAAQDRVDALFRDQDEWTRQALINALSMGPFSSDRSIREYADNIWGIKPVIWK